MAAAKYNIIVEEAASLSLSCVYKDSAGTPISLVGSTADIVLIDNADDATPTTISCTLTDPVNGAFDATMTAAQITALGFLSGRYTIELSGAINDTLLYGKFQVRPLKY